MKRVGMMITKFNRPLLVRLVALAITIFTVVSVDANAQQVTKKEYVLRGKVEQVDTTAKRLTVHSEPIQGWMGEMTPSITKPCSIAWKLGIGSPRNSTRAIQRCTTSSWSRVEVSQRRRAQLIKQASDWRIWSRSR